MTQKAKSSKTQQNIEITVVRKADGILSKRIALRDGKIESDGSHCCMTNGEVRAVRLDGVEAFADLIDTMPSDQALTLGRLRDDQPEEVEIVVKDKLPDHPNAIARTAEYFVFKPGRPAFMLLDHDRKGIPSEALAKLKAGGFWKAVSEAVPGIADVARVHRSSTSSGLYNKRTKQNFAGSRNLHTYIMIQDGADLERALKTLHDRLWLAGLGYYIVGAIGQLLDRSIARSSMRRCTVRSGWSSKVRRSWCIRLGKTRRNAVPGSSKARSSILRPRSHRVGSRTHAT
jgi:hypothetical protein